MQMDGRWGGMIEITEIRQIQLLDLFQMKLIMFKVRG